MAITQAQLAAITASPQAVQVASQLMPSVTTTTLPTVGLTSLQTPTRTVSNQTPSVGILLPQGGHKIDASDVQAVASANLYQLAPVFGLTIYNTGSTATVPFFNESADVFNNANSHCTYTYSSTAGSALISSFLYLSRGGVGALIYRVDMSFYLIQTGGTQIADSIGANNANFAWADGNMFGDFTYQNLPSMFIGRQDFSDQTFSLKFKPKNISKFTQGNVNISGANAGTGIAGGLASLIFYTNPA